MGSDGSAQIGIWLYDFHIFVQKFPSNIWSARLTFLKPSSHPVRVKLSECEHRTKPQRPTVPGTNVTPHLGCVRALSVTFAFSAQ